MLRRLSLPLCLLLISCGAPPDNGFADTILFNGRFKTEDPRQPQVSAVAVRDSLVQARGSEEVVRRYRGPLTEIVDMEGAFVIAGRLKTHATPPYRLKDTVRSDPERGAFPIRVGVPANLLVLAEEPLANEGNSPIVVAVWSRGQKVQSTP